MATALFCIFRGNTTIHGAAARLPNGAYYPVVTVTTLEAGKRAVTTHRMDEHNFQTFNEAARFGLDHVQQMVPNEIRSA